MFLFISAGLRWAGMGLGALILASCATHGVHNASVTEASPGETQDAAAARAATAAYAAFPLVRLTAPGARSTGAWQHHPLPGKKPTVYSFAPVDGRLALSATAVASASILRQTVQAAPEAMRQITFSWKVPQLIKGADLSQRETHDSPVRVALAFDGDRSRFSMKNAMLSELAMALTGEPLPYATLMYVWCNQCKPGEVLLNPRTDRIREIALESGPDHLGQWRNYERDIRADFEKAFGEPPGDLMTVGLMTDTDNTKESTTAWYGPIALTP